jgi:hypothetical protein
MEPSNEPTTSGPKRSLLIGAAVLAICAVVYFSYYTSSPGVDNASGTIGAAKKYRSGQIAESDVKLAEAGTHTAVTVKDPADENAATELRSTAAALGITARDLGAQQSFDRTAAADLARAAAELGKTAQVVLDHQASLEKTVVADLQSQASALQKSAAEALNNQASLAKSAIVNLENSAQLLERASLAAQPAFERTAVAEFSRTAESLNNAAKDLGSHQGFDKSAVAELQSTAAALAQAAQAIGRAGSIDRNEVATLMQQARELDRTATGILESKSGLSRNAAADLGQKSQALEKQLASFERTASATLEQKASSDQ